MTLANVLGRLEENEARSISLSNQYGQDALRLSEKQSENALSSLTDFSTTLAEHLVWEKEREIEDQKAEGAIKAIEGDIEKIEEEGSPDISEEELYEYFQGKEFLQQNKIAFDTSALLVQQQGGSYQDSEAVSKMSGWELYGYTRQKAIMAGDSYKSWMEGEMMNDDKTKISYRGREFTPATADDIAEKEVAMTALRRRYLRERGLLGVSRKMLADEDVGFYDKIIPAHNQIIAQYTKDDAIRKSFLKEEEATRDFVADKDFGSLISSLAITWDKNGNKRGYRGALDKAIEIIKGQVDIGEWGDDELAAIRNQEIEIDGKTVKVGKHWKTRFDKLAEEIEEEQNDNVKLELDIQARKGDEIKRDFRNWIKERKKNNQEVKEVHLEKWAEIYEAATGDSAPSFITDFKSKEDRDDEEDIKRLKKLRQKKEYLVESDLDDVSENVYQQMIGFVREDKPIADAPGSYNTEAKAKIRAWGISAVEMKEGQNDTPLFVEGYWNAYRDYERLFANYIRFGEPVHKAQGLALQDVEDNFQLDKGNLAPNHSKYWTSTKPDAKRVTKSEQLVRDIATGIATVNKHSTKQEVLNSLSETILPGSESYLAEGQKYKEGKRDTIPHYYRRIAEDFEDLSDWDILDAQLKADGVKEGLGDRPEVLEVLDDPLLKDLKRKLNKLTTSNQIEQAKHDVDDMESFESGLFSYSIFNIDETLLTPGLYTPVV